MNRLAKAKSSHDNKHGAHMLYNEMVLHERALDRGEVGVYDGG